MSVPTIDDSSFRDCGIDSFNKIEELKIIGVTVGTGSHAKFNYMNQNFPEYDDQKKIQMEVYRLKLI